MTNPLSFSGPFVSYHTVRRKTLALLGLTLIPTVVGANIGVHSLFPFVSQHPFLAALGIMIVMSVLFAGIRSNRNNGFGVALLLLATLLFGVMLGPILQIALHMPDGPRIIGFAVGGTSFILVSLATLATVTKKDFGFMSQFLLVGLIMLVLVSIANLFLHLSLLAIVVSAMAVMVFSGYLLQDVGRVINDGEDSPVMATLSIYLDVYNIFINLLSLLMMLSGNRRN